MDPSKHTITLPLADYDELIRPKLSYEYLVSEHNELVKEVIHFLLEQARNGKIMGTSSAIETENYMVYIDRNRELRYQRKEHGK